MSTDLKEGPGSWLIRKGGYFYRPNCRGYTTRKEEAGRYTEAKAKAEASVEPWHMSAVLADDVPDPPHVHDKRDAEIARLSQEAERLTKDLQAAMREVSAAGRARGEAEGKLAAAEARVKVLEEAQESARQFVKRHPSLTLIDLAEFEAFLKLPATLDAALEHKEG